MQFLSVFGLYMFIWLDEFDELNISICLRFTYVYMVG